MQNQFLPLPFHLSLSFFKRNTVRSTRLILSLKGKKKKKNMVYRKKLNYLADIKL